MTLSVWSTFTWTHLSLLCLTVQVKWWRRTVPVIIAEISAQCVHIEEQSHRAAHQLHYHLNDKEEKRKSRNEWHWSVPVSVCCCPHCFAPAARWEEFQTQHRSSNPFSVQGWGFSPHICSYCVLSLMNGEYPPAFHPESRSETSRCSNTLSNTQHACDIWKRRACAEINSQERSISTIELRARVLSY